MSDVLSSPLSITLDGERTTVETGTTGADLFQGRRDVVVLRVNGQLKDLDTPVAEGDEVEGVTIDSPDGLDVDRKSVV